MAEEMGLYSEVYSANTIFYKKETEWTLKDVQLCKVTGQIVPEYENTFKDSTYDYQHTDFNLLNEEG